MGFMLTEEQKLLIDKLILNEELKERYIKYGLCEECQQPNTDWKWCKPCTIQNFQNWSSGNADVDKIIQESQLRAKVRWEKIEWIEYDKFENIEYITKGGSGTIYKAYWEDKPTNLNNMYINLRIYGITKDPKTSNFMIVMQYAENGNLRYLSKKVIEQIKDFNIDDLTEEQELLIDILILNEELKERYIKYGLCEECQQPNTDNNQYCQSCCAKDYLIKKVIKQIKDFDHRSWMLTKKQKLLIDKLILNEELKERYKKYGLCGICEQPNTGNQYCQSCCAEYYQLKFRDWTSGNPDVDKLIQESQLDAKNRYETLMWFEYNQFKNIKYITKVEIYQAELRDSTFALKSLNNSKDTTFEFLNEIKLQLKMNNLDQIIKIYGITKDPKTSSFMMVIDFNIDDLTGEQELLIDILILNEELKERYIKYGLCKICRQPNTGNQYCQSCNAKYDQLKFRDWTSGNPDVDKLIQESQLDAKNRYEKLLWFEYNQFKNIEYITEGGFGKIYQAKLLHTTVALKSLNNSKDTTFEFLNEIKLHLKMNNSDRIIKIYGITKDPRTSNFMMVMDYAEKGNLRQRLNRDFNSLNLYAKIDILRDIARGLEIIHEKGLTHQDFHSGNILSRDNSSMYTRITDLGLYKPANEKSDNKKLYGVLPYVAPEVLRGKKYTQESDVYSFGIIIYEVINGLPPYYDMAHEEFLAVKICQGLRPKFNIKVPQLIVDMFKQCVDADPSKRPPTKYLCNIFFRWCSDDVDDKDSQLYKQSVEADKINKKQLSFTKSDNTELIYTTHHQAIYTSRLLDFNNLPKPKNANDGEEYSNSTMFDFTKLNINP
ncbi:kinase-like domain-containing protein [Glomus cerebriforme]|uniref:Kinase-like domain-containing protein n=1 Tax=Glomus cerebriforme TaxID=658196 RepID=A0A397SHB7_9GLOM|nr:kinase-like domain-containing protein [Glomus cerebriforme]